MQRTIAHYESAIHGKVTLVGEVDPVEQSTGHHSLGWIITAKDEDGRELEVPDFELDDAREALTDQATQDATDWANEQAWRLDRESDLEAMSDEDLDAFAFEVELELAARAGAR